MTLRRLLTGAAVFALGAGTAASGLADLPGAAQPTPAPTATPVQPGEEGRLLYLRDCAWCHGNDGTGTDRGPGLWGVGAASADFMLRTGRMPIPEPEVQPRRSDPAYPDPQIRALVSYVASLGGGPQIPEVHPEAGHLAEGLQLYERNCAACHSSTGIGAALTSGLIAPTVLRSTPTEIAEAVRLGGAGLRSGNMPEFDESVIDEQELDSLIAYVLELQEPHDRGGHPLLRLGPVAEGFVTFAVALLLSLLLIRWIGERSGGRE